MGAFTRESVVLVHFPFSDLSNSKLRPAVVLADVGRNDYILCQITSKPYSDPYAIKLDSADFVSGSLQRVSYARGGKLFTANDTLVAKVVGQLKPNKLDSIVDTIVSLLRPI